MDIEEQYIVGLINVNQKTWKFKTNDIVDANVYTVNFTNITST